MRKAKKVNPLQSLQQRWKNRDKGASLVTVLLVVAIVTIIAMVLLSIVLLNWYQKKQHEESQRNFYDAESAMEEVRLGLVTEVSNAAGAAYGDTLARYDVLSEVEKEEYFRQAYLVYLQKALGSKDENNVPDYNHYSVTNLTSYLKCRVRDTEEATGARIETKEDGIANDLSNMRLSAGKQCLVLKNVRVSYVDEKDNYTSITSDISLDYPKIDFANASSMENITCYGLITQQGLQKTDINQSTIKGNAYLGEASNIAKGTVACSGLEEDSRAYLVGENLSVSSGTFSAQKMETWWRNLAVNAGSNLRVQDGITYVQNDISLNHANANATISGDLLAYGNPAVKGLAESLPESADIMDADYSSSIILNGAKGKTKLDLSEVNRLLIAGHNYVNTKEKSIETGQSIMTVADQQAYLVPAELIGKGKEHGGMNPMTAQDFEALQTEMDEGESMVNFNEFPYTEKGVVKAFPDTAYIQVPGLGSMVYFFLEFEDDESRIAYAQKYNSMSVAKISSNLEYYAGDGVYLPKVSTKDPLYFYLNGNVIAGSKDQVILENATISDEEPLQELLKKEAVLLDTYSGLLQSLTRDYNPDLEKTIFENLIQNVPTQTQKITVDENNKAVITAGNYTIKDDAVHLVIAKKNVEVATDFSGLIICGGQLTINGDYDITAAPEKVAELLNMPIDSEKDDKTIGETFFKDPSKYFPSGNSGEEKEIKMSDCVTYENWKKQ